jgi:ribonuclease P protein component
VHTLSKRERLKSKSLMDLAFTEGIKIKAFPVFARATPAELPHDVPFQAAFSVGKRRFRRAVDRNRIKRLLREAWRLEKSELAKNWKPGSTQWAVVFIFVGKDIPSFSDCQLLLRRLSLKLSQAMNEREGSV